MTPPLELAGLGVGPFNLSIAALLDGLKQRGRRIETRFYDSKSGFSWHPGMLLPGVRMQTSYLKDLVTGVDPTNPHSFLNYLVRHQRFYQFLSAELEAVSRLEYADYLAWVASNLDSLEFNARVEEVSFAGDAFQVRFQGEKAPVSARNLCLGTGKSPFVPECARPYLGGNLFHAIGIARRELNLQGKRVAIVGGGQTGAEVLNALLEEHWGAPESVHWVSRRPNYEPLDETPFTNEYFTPQYVDQFHRLPETRREGIVAAQKLASDGISPTTLKALYQKLYERALSQALLPDMRPGRELVDISRDEEGYRLGLHNSLQGGTETVEADVVILCTGFESSIPAYLKPLQGRLDLDTQGRYRLGPDFEVSWDGPEQNRLFAVNAGRHSHGIAEPQMSLMCWRSARIVNRLLGEPVYNLDQAMDLLNWQDQMQPRRVAVAAV